MRYPNMVISLIFSLLRGAKRVGRAGRGGRSRGGEEAPRREGAAEGGWRAPRRDGAMPAGTKIPHVK